MAHCRARLAGWGGGLLLLAACGGEAPDRDGTPAACPDDSLAPGEVRVLASGFEVDGNEGTEGVSFSSDGRLFVGGTGVSGGGFVAEVQPDGSWEPVADVPTSVGLAWINGQLWVSVTDVGDGTAGMVAVDVDSGTTSVAIRGMAGSNFPAVTPWNTLLISSPGGSTVWEVDGLAVSEWATVPSPNGIGFSLDGSTVYVANTYEAPSTVAAIPVSDGVAGTPGVLATLPDGSTQDGLAVGADGTVYVVNNLPGTIAAIQPDGAWEIVAEGVAFGASIAFGEGAFDPCSLVATSLFTDEVFQVGIGQRGAPLYRGMAR